MSNAIEMDPAVSAKKATRLYLLVGLILFCATGATVAVATIPWLDVGGHGFDHWDAILGLMIATTKAAFVAAVYMHLLHERKMVYLILGLGAVHGVGMGFGMLLDFYDPIHDRHFYALEESEGGMTHPPMIFGFPTQSSPRSYDPPPLEADPIEDARPHIEGFPGAAVGGGAKVGPGLTQETEATPGIGLGLHPDLTRETETAEGVRGLDVRPQGQ
jgi:cytochrome c oxidase subunit IV